MDVFCGQIYLIPIKTRVELFLCVADCRFSEHGLDVGVPELVIGVVRPPIVEFQVQVRMWGYPDDVP